MPLPATRWTETNGVHRRLRHPTEICRTTLLLTPQEKACLPESAHRAIKHVSALLCCSDARLLDHNQIKQPQTWQREADSITVSADRQILAKPGRHRPVAGCS